MNISQLENTPGAYKKPKRVGCGPGSGHGKTSCRGEKGQFARSGKGRRRGFEGGQMPLYRRIPKRGFTNIFGREYGLVNLDTFNRFSEGTDITPELIYSSGLVKRGLHVKVLGRGRLERKFTITAHKFSKSAKEIIEKSGSSWKEISKKPETTPHFHESAGQ